MSWAISLKALCAASLFLAQVDASPVRGFRLRPPSATSTVAQRDDANYLNLKAENYDKWRALVESGQCDRFGEAMANLQASIGKEHAVYGDMTMLWFKWILYVGDWDAGTVDCKMFWRDHCSEGSAIEVFQFMAPYPSATSKVQLQGNDENWSTLLDKRIAKRGASVFATLQVSGRQGNLDLRKFGSENISLERSVPVIQTHGHYEEWESIANNRQCDKFGIAMDKLRQLSDLNRFKDDPIFDSFKWEIWPRWMTYLFLARTRWRPVLDPRGSLPHTYVDCKRFWRDVSLQGESKRVFQLFKPQVSI